MQFVFLHLSCIMHQKCPNNTMLYFVCCILFAFVLHYFCIYFAFLLHFFCICFAFVLHFVRKTKTDDFVARTAPNELIFSGFCRERRGEADSGLRFVFCICLALCTKMQNKCKQNANKIPMLYLSCI